MYGICKITKPCEYVNALENANLVSQLFILTRLRLRLNEAEAEAETEAECTVYVKLQNHSTM